MNSGDMKPLGIVSFFVGIFWFPYDLVLSLEDNAWKSLNDKAPRYHSNVKKSISQKLTFTWVNDLIKLGNSRPLKLSDLHHFDPSLISKATDIFYDHYSRESQISKPDFSTKSFVLFDLWKFPATRAVFKMYSNQFLYAGLLKFIKSCLQFLPSIIVSNILTFIEVRQETCPSFYVEKLGLFYAFALLAVLIVKTIVDNQFFDESITLGATVRTTLSAAVYRKLLLLSSESRTRYSVRYCAHYIFVSFCLLSDVI